MCEDSQGSLANLWAVGGEQYKDNAVAGFRSFYKFCPKCGWQLTGKFSTCPRCGADLNTMDCPFCGGDIPTNAKNCPRCCAPLG